MNPGRSAILNDIKRKFRRSQAMLKKQQEEEMLTEAGKSAENIQPTKGRAKKQKEEEIEIIEIKGIVKKTQAQK